jgi:hypothetical protein
VDDDAYEPAPRRRSWLIVLPTAVVAVIAILWAGFWYYAASQAKQAIADWRAREAQFGRSYTCAQESYGGFPFRLEVSCADAVAQILSSQPQMVVTTKDIRAAVQVYDPSLLIAEMTGPLTVAEGGRPANLSIDWATARSSISGLPSALERMSMVLDKPTFSRPGGPGGPASTLASADHTEWHVRVKSGSVFADPVLDVAVTLTKASAPGLVPFLTQPVDADVVGVLSGLRDLAPKTLAERFREIQAANGRLEITRARVQQGDVLALATGTLRVSPHGRLDGDLQVTVAGLEKILPALGLDQLVASLAGNDRLAPMIGQLDRLVPGLGGLVRGGGRGNGGNGLSVTIGEPTQLEGRRAMTLPLRFADGVAFLGPFKIGQTPALF